MDIKEQHKASARAICPIDTFLDMRIDSIENGIYWSKIPPPVNT